MKMDWRNVGKEFAEAYQNFVMGINDFYELNELSVLGREDTIDLVVSQLFNDIFNEVITMEKNNKEDWEKVE